MLGIGIGIVGLVNTSDGLILCTSNTKGCENIALIHLLKEEFNTDVIVDNTVCCIVLSEKSYGVTRELSNFLYIYLERGMG